MVTDWDTRVSTQTRSGLGVRLTPQSEQLSKTGPSNLLRAPLTRLREVTGCLRFWQCSPILCVCAVAMLLQASSERSMLERTDSALFGVGPPNIHCGHNARPNADADLPWRPPGRVVRFCIRTPSVWTPGWLFGAFWEVALAVNLFLGFSG